LVALLAPANSATNRRRVGESFSHFIPPLLLSSRPDLFFAAINASKRSINVVTSSDKLGGSIAVIRREQRFVNGYQPRGQRGAFEGFRHDRALQLKLLSSRRNFLAPLFAAFHRYFRLRSSAHSALQLGQSTAAAWVSLPRRLKVFRYNLDYFIRLPANRLAESNDGKPAIDPTLCSLYRSRTDSHPNDLAQPQLNVQYRIRRDQIGESFVTISEMRTQAHLTVAAWFHADQRIFDSSDCSSFP